MRRYMLLHIGFEKPTPEIMARWKSWFEAIADRSVENVGLRNGREVSHNGAKDLPMAADSLTGYTIINAESVEEAEAMARSNPFIAAIRIYELATH